MFCGRIVNPKSGREVKVRAAISAPRLAWRHTIVYQQPSALAAQIPNRKAPGKEPGAFVTTLAT